jgi:hypothetical protein
MQPPPWVFRDGYYSDDCLPATIAGKKMPRELQVTSKWDSLAQAELPHLAPGYEQPPTCVESFTAEPDLGRPIVPAQPVVA